jgi:hypothetical protein
MVAGILVACLAAAQTGQDEPRPVVEIGPPAPLDNTAAGQEQVYYVIVDSGGPSQSVYRLPVTGRDTVAGALAAIGGVPVGQRGKTQVWVQRPDAPAQLIDLKGIAFGTTADFPLRPGDRVWIGEPLFEPESHYAYVIMPWTRFFGVTLRGTPRPRWWWPFGG